jgi:hypothetical protein
MSDPDRIWLQNAEDARAIGDRLWCADKVWPECPEQNEPTEYVRADLYAKLERELADGRRNAFEEAAEIIRARMPLYTEPQALNACHECISSIEGAKEQPHSETRQEQR